MNILILGGGAGGAVLASRLAKKLGEKVNITVVDKNPYHEFRPSYLWISMGIREPDHARRPLKLLEKKKIRFLNEEVLSIDLANRQVKTTNHVLNYDYLAISLGAELVPEKIKGLDKIYHPWEMDTSLKLREEIARFKGGKVVVGPTRLPHRCPPRLLR
jgi:sulfide:quinone oxidoreductase